MLSVSSTFCLSVRYQSADSARAFLAALARANRASSSSCALDIVLDEELLSLRTLRSKADASELKLSFRMRAKEAGGSDALGGVRDFLATGVAEVLSDPSSSLARFLGFGGAMLVAFGFSPMAFMRK